MKTTEYTEKYAFLRPDVSKKMAGRYLYMFLALILFDQLTFNLPNILSIRKAPMAAKIEKMIPDSTCPYNQNPVAKRVP